MLLRCATICFFFVIISVQAQDNLNIKISNDTISFQGVAVGFISENNGEKIAQFVNTKALRKFKKQRTGSDISEFIVDEYILTPRLHLDFQSSTITSPLGELIATFEKIESQDAKCVLRVKLNRTANTEDLRFIKYCFLRNYSFEQNCYFIFESAKLQSERLSSEERYRLKKEQEYSKKQEERDRVERFYAMLTARLSQDLDPIEGVYKSIDQGESYEYDIAILKSPSNSREYISLVLSSTDPAMTIGSGIFTFTKTAGKDVYFVSYQNKAGEQFENKTAVFDGVILGMGVKSFVKMFPSEGESNKYNEINPLYDWESSGSGVLINNKGYIVTNNHVISDAKKIRIAFQNDSLDYNAIIISQNEQTDVAILRIEDKRFYSNLKPVSWNINYNLGQKVFTLGYPISSKMSNNVKVVDGIVSGTNGRSGDPMFFQTTLPVWYGNSGGPCFNSKGEILGLATQILWDRGEKVDNVAYITKTENIFDLGKELIEKGKNDGEDKNLEQLIERLIPYSVFIKVNY